MAYKFNTLDQLRKIAHDLNCDLYVAGERELLVDLDTSESFGHFDKFLPLVAEKFGLSRQDSWVSRNSKLHRVVEIARDDVSRIEKIALQLALGSDPKREILALFEAHMQPDGPDTNSLFKPRSNA